VAILHMLATTLLTVMITSCSSSSSSSLLSLPLSSSSSSCSSSPLILLIAVITPTHSPPFPPPLPPQKAIYGEYFYRPDQLQKRRSHVSIASPPNVTTDAIRHAIEDPFPKTHYVVANLGGTPGESHVAFVHQNTALTRLPVIYLSH